MFPDRNPYQAPGPAALPQPVQSAPQAGHVESAHSAPAALPVAAESGLQAAVTRVKLLTDQYGANPYAFSVAFQQLKAQYLRDQYHIDPNTEKH
jgi:hypothetical protein